MSSHVQHWALARVGPLPRSPPCNLNPHHSLDVESTSSNLHNLCVRSASIMNTNTRSRSNLLPLTHTCSTPMSPIISHRTIDAPSK